MLACETVEIADVHDPNESGVKNFTALGLLRGAAILPISPNNSLSTARWAGQHRVDVLGLPESVGLRCTGGTATVIGTGQLSRIRGHGVKRVRPGDSFDIATQ